MKRKPKIAGALRAPFHMPTFLGHILTDLSDGAPELCAHLRTMVHSPSDFRSAVGDALANADLSTASVLHIATLRQLDACVSKLDSWGSATPEARQASALTKFKQAERRCARSNKRIMHFREHFRRLPAMVRNVISEAIDYVHTCFGSMPTDEVLSEGCGFGPGLTFGLRGIEQRDLMYKVSSAQTVTPQCRSLAIATVRDSFPNWAEHLASQGLCLDTVAGNRIAFVPKTAQIDRTIGIEPSLNVFLQKGVDVYLRKRLSWVSNLRLENQDFSVACMRKHGLDIATIDLSSASDSISTELVRWFLPADWYTLLDTLRSKMYTLDGGLTFDGYHKFSSMGNAFTFPLESVIFMAVARGAARVAGYSDTVLDQVRVYGDDIIVPWQCAGLVIEVLNFLGFKTNPDKTFVFGPFRETCGVDLLNGIDIRPVFLRSVPTRAWNVASLFNRLLTNRFGFTFNATLAYLATLPVDFLTGPAYFGWASVTSCDWKEWYAGRNTEGDAYFFAPHPHHVPVRVTRQEHNEYYVAAKRWQQVRRSQPLELWSEEACHLAFLYGLHEGRPLGTPVMREMEIVSTIPYPPLDWWPAVYTEPAPASLRILRVITGAVVGESGY